MIEKLKTLKNTKPLLFNAACGLLTALLFSAFLYFEHFGITSKFINTIFALAALTLLLYSSKKSILFAGFFMGIFWFYWVGFSFKHQGVTYMEPIITLFFGFLYTLFFGVLALTNKVYLRAILLFGLSYVEPIDLNWLQIELIFIESYIGIAKYQLILVLLALSLPTYIPKKMKYLPLLFIVVAFNFNAEVPQESKLKIKLVATDIAQEKKWKRESLRPTITMIYQHIDEAIENKYDLIIFPESIFPLYMNKNPHVLNTLLIKSHHITIVAGSLLRENKQNFNVTYMIQDGKYEIAKKMLLVPFGEYIPLPKFARKIINDTFFNSQADFTGASEPTDFIIKGETFRNAICWEATCPEIYEGDVKFLIATSNNAWFAPSIEPTLQNLLLRYYARKNNITVYHSVNSKGTGVIK
ncbi:apolipoprotein N-acyltransferase [Sulfurimonas sp. SAG-AH-194-I05]|nr:apolipoprotein N-acyltransferase [Sulfurimonas sp. SAG-AH-194-I05]MDF1874649.1 apolipoprotein N-acyltransferase [Sulfurimonas sp. SAG-AH-194-I05]